MSTTVSMPQLGETVTEGTILKWAKQVGDSISEDEVLVEISTDKVDTEVPSPAAGTILEILVEEGDTVQVGTPLVVIGEAGEQSDDAGGGDQGEDAGGGVADESVSGSDDLDTKATEGEDAASGDQGEDAGDGDADASESGSDDSDTKATEGEGSAPTPAKASSDSDAAAASRSETSTPEPGAKPSAAEIDAFFAEPDETDKKPQLLSPVVRKLIRENDVNLSAVTGTGQGGRVTRRDVEAYLEGGPSQMPVPAAASAPSEGASEKPRGEGVSTPTETERVTPVAGSPVSADGSEEVELDRLRVRIGENMAKAKRTAAHVWTSVEVDFEKVERVRQAHKAVFKAAEGFSLTYLPFISRAVIDALKAYPVVNSSLYLEEKKAVFHKNVNLGIAIDLNEGGLVVGSVRNADGLRMVGLARAVRDLAEKARGKGLDLDDITGSTFTITNPGPFGSFMSAPIINVPNVAILSTDTVTKRPTVVTTSDGQDMIAIRHIGYLGLSWDHRAFDGSTAVLFLRRIKENLESWDWEQELS